MTTTIGDLAVRIGADTEGFSRGMRRTKRQLGDLAKKARKGANDFVKYGAAATAAGTAVAAGLAVKSARAAKEINNLSRLANTSASEFQKMAFGARSVNIEQDKLSDILKDVNDRVGDFITTGGGPMADFFEKIAPAVGVTAEQFQKLSGPDALQLYVDSLEKANLSQAEMTFFMEAMASDATALLPLLRDGGKALAEQAREAEALGVALSDLDTERLAQLGEQLDKSGDVVGSLVDQMSADFTPVLQAINAEFLDMVKELGGVDDVSETVFNNVIKGAGFILDAVEGVRRSFEVAGKGIAVFALGVQESMLMAADFIVNRPVEAVNELIEALNVIPGIDLTPIGLTGFGQDIQDALSMTRTAVAEGMQDISDTIAAPLPSTAFEQFVNDAQESSDAAAKIKADARAKELTQQEDFDTYLNDLIAGGQEILTEVERKNSQERARLAEQEAAAREAALGGALANLAVLMQSESKKMFKIGKAAAIAQTLVSTYTGAQESYAALAGIPVVGPALGTAAAAAAIAAGFVRLQAIKAQQFGGGAARSGAAAGGGVAAPQVGSASAGGAGGLGAQTIGVTGIDPNQLFRGDQIIDLINTAQENGARLVLQQ